MSCQELGPEQVGNFFGPIDCGACPLLGVKRRTKPVQNQECIVNEFFSLKTLDMQGDWGWCQAQVKTVDKGFWESVPRQVDKKTGVPKEETAAAKSLQSCPTLCNPREGSPPGSLVPGILQARTLEWVAISSSKAWKWKVKGKLLSRVWLFATPGTAAYQAPPSMGFSRQEY